MFYKHWKKIILSIAALFWSGCGDDPSSSDVRTSCTFRGGVCPDYGVDFYYCENPEDYDSPNKDEKCTFYSRLPCLDYYECEDGASCKIYEDETTMTCFDTLGNRITEDEFKSKYYVENESIH